MLLESTVQLLAESKPMSNWHPPHASVIPLLTGGCASVSVVIVIEN